ncbi:MAG: hypothetical protein EBU90_01475 [Proteobacteria bacterium]|nr:hypothetical protein [Pseudomonadota bacterium]
MKAKIIISSILILILFALIFATHAIKIAIENRDFGLLIINIFIIGINIQNINMISKIAKRNW